MPVASTNAAARIARLADEVITLEVDPGFTAVGRYYQEFAQVNDGEVVALLKASARR